MIHLNDALLAALRLGDLDLTVNALPGVMPEDLQAVPLIEDALCMVVRNGHPLLARRRLRLADLVDAAWMLPGPEVAARRNVEGRLAEAGLPPPRVAVEVGNTAAQLSRLLVQSDLVSIVSESQLQGPAGEGLVALPFVEARFLRTIGALTRKGATLPPLAQRFLELLQEESASRKAAGPARRRAIPNEYKPAAR
jgi:DNA-binding transcriptional LysR family regulator